MAASKLQAFWNHPAGPKTIHFWAPTSKWIISIANFADFSKPPEMVSYPQEMGLCVVVVGHGLPVVGLVTAIGLSNWADCYNSKNWNLFSVNVAMAGTGLYQITRKMKHDYFSEREAAVERD